VVSGRVLLLTVRDGFVCAHEARRPNHIHDEGSSEHRSSHRHQLLTIAQDQVGATSGKLAGQLKDAPTDIFLY
jgi:hypothetical protein